jgi:hypothetical protein
METQEHRPVRSEARYKVFMLAEEAFAVAIDTPGVKRTRVTGFRSYSDAKRWIDDHRSGLGEA